MTVNYFFTYIAEVISQNGIKESCSEWIADTKNFYLYLGKTGCIFAWFKGIIKKATEYEVNCDGKVLKSQSSGKYLGIEIE